MGFPLPKDDIKMKDVSGELVSFNNVKTGRSGYQPHSQMFPIQWQRKLVYQGASDHNPADSKSVSRRHVTIAIDELFSGNKIPVNKTRSVGCTVQQKELCKRRILLVILIII